MRRFYAEADDPSLMPLDGDYVRAPVIFQRCLARTQDMIISVVEHKNGYYVEHDKKCVGCDAEYHTLMLLRGELMWTRILDLTFVTTCTSPIVIDLRFFSYAMSISISHEMTTIGPIIICGRKAVFSQHVFLPPFLINGHHISCPGVGPQALISPEVFEQMRAVFICLRRRGVNMPLDIRYLLAQFFTEVIGWYKFPTAVKYAK